MLKVISFYTSGTPYEGEADRLRKSCEVVGMAHHIVGRPPWGDWYANTHQKAQVIRELRAELRGPLLWVDADAVMRRNVTNALIPLLDDYDLGVHYFAGNELLTGTMLMADNTAVSNMLFKWCHYNATHESDVDQVTLAAVIESAGAVRVCRLPPEYCFIFDLSAQRHPNVTPAIEHLQASRENRYGFGCATDPARQRRINDLESVT